MAASLSSTPAGMTPAAAGSRASAATGIGPDRVMIGVPVRTRDCTTIAPPKMDCSATRPPSSPWGQADRVGDHPGAGLDGQPLLPFPCPRRVAGMSTAAGDLVRRYQRGQHPRRPGQPHRPRSRRPSATYTLAAPNSASRFPAACGPAAQPHHRRLAELAGQREQFAGDLLDRLAVMLGEHQNSSHRCPSRLRCRIAQERNSAAFTPPSPSSLTTVPACRGGRFAKLITSVAAAARPTWPASRPHRPRTQRLHRASSLAAMIPSNDG